MVYIARHDSPPLEAGQYYFHELYGLQVIDEQGRTLGELREIIKTGANDVYGVSRPDGSELLLPAIPEVILQIDLVKQLIRVHLLDGLEQDETGGS
jgi:16S rRNA processing protein RimM